MPASNAAVTEKKPTARSRITNGSALLPSVDGRSLWARRMRDLMEAHTDDMGGAEYLSEAERSLARRAAVIEVELEYQETALAEARMNGQPVPADALDLYAKLSNTLRRLLVTTGLRRRARDVLQDLPGELEPFLDDDGE